MSIRVELFSSWIEFFNIKCFQNLNQFFLGFDNLNNERILRIRIFLNSFIFTSVDTISCFEEFFSNFSNGIFFRIINLSEIRLKMYLSALTLTLLSYCSCSSMFSISLSSFCLIYSACFSRYSICVAIYWSLAWLASTFFSSARTFFSASAKDYYVFISTSSSN